MNSSNLNTIPARLTDDRLCFIASLFLLYVSECTSVTCITNKCHVCSNPIKCKP